VHLLHTMVDTFALTAHLARQPESTLVVGAGYIGLEMAEALTMRGLQVTVVEQLPQVLATVDAPLAALVADELTDHGVEVHTGTVVTSVEKAGARLAVTGHATDDPTTPFTRTVDLVLVVVGVRPDTALAEKAGVTLGACGALVAARTGLREHEAADAGFAPASTTTRTCPTSSTSTCPTPRRWAAPTTPSRPPPSSGYGPTDCQGSVPSALDDSKMTQPTLSQCLLR
jgi:threonine dehydrogenase-like Zn-dependent dehydrogenase